jgi:hypothetical protein
VELTRRGGLPLESVLAIDNISGIGPRARGKEQLMAHESPHSAFLMRRKETPP